MMRYITYFLIILVFSLFTANLLLGLDNSFNLEFTKSDIINYILLSWPFAFISILTMLATRNITSSYGRFLLLKAKLALKFNLYVIQILVFVLWIFVLSFLLYINNDFIFYTHESYFTHSLLFSLLYGLVIDLLLNGLTIFRSRK